jgi:hypothetical protein
MVATKKNVVETQHQAFSRRNPRFNYDRIMIQTAFGMFFRRGTHGGQVFAEVWGEFSMFLLHE